LIEGVPAQTIAADKAYDADAFIQTITQAGTEAVVPPRQNRHQTRHYDQHKYKHRNLIKRFFCRLKEFRRIATRYDKLASRFSAFIALVASFVWLA
jgi:transposase